MKTTDDFLESQKHSGAELARKLIGNVEKELKKISTLVAYTELSKPLASLRGEVKSFRSAVDSFAKQNLGEADFKQRYGSSRNDDMVVLTQSGKLLPMQYVPGDSNYVYTKTTHKRYKRIAHNKRVSPRDALAKFHDWLKLDDD